MNYNLIKQIKSGAEEKELFIETYSKLHESLVDVFGFNSEDIICTEADFESYIDSTNNRELFETSSAATAKAGERDWVEQIASQRKNGSYDSKKMGPMFADKTPKKNDIVLLPGKLGIGYIMDPKPDQEGNIMVIDTHGHRFKANSEHFAASPKRVKNKEGTEVNAWMLKKIV